MVLYIHELTDISHFKCDQPGTLPMLKLPYTIFSRMLRDSTPRFVGPSVRPSVRRSVGPSVRHTLLFLGFCGFWPHCSCPNDLVTSISAPAHPHATGVAVYPALFQMKVLASYEGNYPSDDLKFPNPSLNRCTWHETQHAQLYTYSQIIRAKEHSVTRTITGSNHLHNESDYPS